MVVQTVLGKIPGSELGRILTHEHLHLKYHKFKQEAPTPISPYLQGEITLANVGFVQRYPYSSEINLDLNDEEAVLYDVKLLKEHGGGTIVENTTHGIHRNAVLLKHISQQTGVHIVAGTGFYLASSQPASNLNLSVEDMYLEMKREMTDGCKEDDSVRCGFLGEVASNITPEQADAFEVRSIAATGELQAELHCPVSFHPGRHRDSPFEIMRRFTEAGGDSSKCVMSHLDRTLTEESDLLDFAEAFNAYLQHDLFGTEVLTYQFSPQTQMPSDRQRIDRIRHLIDSGFKHRLLISHDIHTRHRLVRYGGHGYMHIFANVLPKMHFLGFTTEETDAITINNPAAWLSY